MQRLPSDQYNTSRLCDITGWLQLSSEHSDMALNNLTDSLTYKVLTTSQPTYLFKLVSVQSPCSTQSSSVVTISRPPTSSALKITNRSFQHTAPHLWNKLPHSFRESHPHLGLSPSHNPTQVRSTLSSPPFSPSIIHSLFHSRLKKNTSSSSLFHRRLHHRYSSDWSHRLPTVPFSLAYRICFSFRLSAAE